MNDWAKRKLAELEASIAKPHKKALYAKVDLESAAKACKAMNCLKAMVYLWLACKARSKGYCSVKATNIAVAKYGVSRDMKRRALAELEAAGVISIVRSKHGSPVVTLLSE